MRYRREIDGLRALAVLPVVLFHAGFEEFEGGFVGVDVFFVISGYLITTIILAEREQGKFSFINFCERRARRILPALYLVMISCIPFAYFWMLPSDVMDFSQSLVAASLIISNILFWRESGYFDSTGELKPLLHTWSLSVEAQFYLFFPLILIVLWKLGKRYLLLILTVVFVGSLTAAQWGAYNRLGAAFYLLPSRLWEFLMGVFVAFYFSQASRENIGRLQSEFLSWLGVGIILYSVFTYSEETPFPGFSALAPALGTVLIILYTTQGTSVGKFVGNKVLVSIGLISYSVYLWHQPLFAIARHKESLEPDQMTLIMLVIVSFILAYFSWRFIEVPFRNKSVINRRNFIISLVSFVAILNALAWPGIYANGFNHRLPPNIVYESLGAKIDALGDVCDVTPVIGFDGVVACNFGAIKAQKSVVLYGDSHAQALSGYLNGEFIKHDIKGILIRLDGCEVVPTITEMSQPIQRNVDCTKAFSSLLAYIKSNDADVIVSSRWSFKLFPVEGFINQMPYKNSEGGVEQERYRQYAVNANGNLKLGVESKRVALRNMIEGLLETNQRIFLIYPVPEIAWNIAKKTFLYYRQYNSTLSTISIPYEDYKARNEFVMKVFDSFIKQENFYAVRTSEVFCNTFIDARCVAQYDSVPYYYDDDHLSDVGARLVVDNFFQKLLDE